MNLVKIAVTIFCFCLVIDAMGQQLDSNSIIASAIIKSVSLDRHVWSNQELENIFQQINTVNMEVVESEGFEDIWFFKLNYPEGGLIREEIEQNMFTTFDPDLTINKITFAYDDVTNEIFALNEASLSDIKLFFFRVRERLKNRYANIYKKRVWLSELSIEGVSMVSLWRVGKQLRHIKY